MNTYTAKRHTELPRRSNPLPGIIRFPTARTTAVDSADIVLEERHLNTFQVTFSSGSSLRL